MFPWERFEPEDAEGAEWDAVIVGAGMGGSVIGLALARKGWRVLLLERGTQADPFAPREGGQGLRRIFSSSADSAVRAAGGRWDRRFKVRHGERVTDVYLPVGSGPGGSSAIYGATLERFRREDYDAATDHDAGLTPLPNGWAVDYDLMLPYYRQSEALFGVIGDRDPTDPDDDFAPLAGPPMCARDRHFLEIFDRSGLCPHRMRIAIQYKPGCADCLGRLCARDCKSEGASRALKPALTSHGAKLLTGCVVERLEMDGDRVSQVICRHGDRPLRIRGRIVVLAAGSLASPAILLRSKDKAWPNGIGNHTGLVGRGLMFHGLQIFAMWPRGRFSTAGPAKTLSSRVANQVEGVRLGGLQSFAQRVSASQIWQYLQDLLEDTAPALASKARVLCLVLAAVSARVFRNAALFALLTEDFAYRENRVVLDETSESGVAVEYQATPGLKRRAAAVRNFMRRRLAPNRLVFLSHGPTPNYGHACGTCRMGASPADGVVGTDNRVHGVSNLYVVDASFFPTSAATNPSLTIAANALRVADILGQSPPGRSETRYRKDTIVA